MTHASLQKGIMLLHSVLLATLMPRDAEWAAGVLAAESTPLHHVWASQRRVVLFGAMGRHNFGDLLMPHVLARVQPWDSTIQDHTMPSACAGCGEIHPCHGIPFLSQL